MKQEMLEIPICMPHRRKKKESELKKSKAKKVPAVKFQEKKEIY